MRVKILHENFIYIPNLINCVSILTQTKSHSY
jgi:hypothetical protein